MPELAQEQSKQAADPRDLAQQLGALVTDMRSRRLPIESSWLDFHKCWRGIRTRSWFNSEVFKTFVPAARRAIEKNTIKLTQMLLPSPEFFEVYPGEEYDDNEGKKAESVRAFFMYLFSKRIRIKSLVAQLGRTYYLYGRAIVKTGVRVDYVGDVAEVWPTARAVDPFTFRMWPETVPTIDEAEVLAEDNMMPWDVWETHRKAGKLINVPAAHEITEPEWPWYWGQRLNVSGVPTPASTGGATQVEKDGADRPPKFMAITETWYRKGGTWKMVWLLWNCTQGPIIVRQYTPELGRHPYRGTVARQLPGEQYTTGMMDDLEPLNVILNDQWDMTLEGQAMSFAPIAVIDPSLIGRSGAFKYTARAKWFCDPNGVRFLEAPDTARAGYQGISATTQMIESFSADNPLSNGTPVRGMPRAGFAVSSMLNLSLADIKDAAQSIEDDILTPMMGDIYANTMLYVPDEQKFRIPGTREFPPRRVSAVDLAGDYEFRWVGSLQSQDMQVRAQRLISTLATLGKLGPQVSQDLAGKGKKLNWEALLKRIWRDGLGERGADAIVVDMSPQEIQKMQQPPAPPQPKVSVALKGDLDPLVSRDLATATPVPPVAQPQPAPGGGGQTPQAPGSDQQFSKGVSRSMAEAASGG